MNLSIELQTHATTKTLNVHLKKSYVKVEWMLLNKRLLVMLVCKTPFYNSLAGNVKLFKLVIELSLNWQNIKRFRNFYQLNRLIQQKKSSAITKI